MEKPSLEPEFPDFYFYILLNCNSHQKIKVGCKPYVAWEVSGRLMNQWLVVITFCDKIQHLNIHAEA